ncbi:MAG: hypothetical protein JXR73_10575 [Candidatus Omnitrophica bacterium]|nr:hypothetical protein [Candidatus Omnitrophota bacterium]
MRTYFLSNRIVFWAAWSVWAGLTAASVQADSNGVIFLIQNKWGGIHGVSLDSNGAPSSPSMVRSTVDNARYPMVIDLDAYPEGGFQLTVFGQIIPIGSARLPYAAWAPIRDATALTMASGHGGGWIAAGGGIKKIGNPPPLILSSLDPEEVIADMEFDPQAERLAVLTRKGTISLCTALESKVLGVIPLKKDQAIDIEFAPDGFWILTELGNVYHWNSDGVSSLQNLPDLGKGLACDLERSLTGDGFYILDIFGVIHACAGAPPVPTEPLTQPAAVDLEILPGEELPRWDPPGLNTRVGWGISSVLLDPQGPPKPVSLIVEKAEYMTLFLAQIHYDPNLIEIDPYSVRVGAWWNEGLRVSRINPVVDAKNGVLTLQGSGDYFPYEGATGDGELARFAVAPVQGVTEAVAVLDVQEFTFRDSYQGNLDHACPVINSCTVHIAPIQPRLDFAVKKDDVWISGETFPAKPGEIVQADVLIENGSRIVTFEFGFQFTREKLRFLGMTPGGVWRPDYEIKTIFEIPSMANRRGQLERQRLEASQVGACRDWKNSIVTLFFAVNSPGQAIVQLNDFLGKDWNENPIDIQTANTIITLQSE